jgi:hypothetical protein
MTNFGRSYCWAGHSIDSLIDFPVDSLIDFPVDCQIGS